MKITLKDPRVLSGMTAAIGMLSMYISAQGTAADGPRPYWFRSITWVLGIAALGFGLAALCWNLTKPDGWMVMWRLIAVIIAGITGFLTLVIIWALWAFAPLAVP